MNRMLPYAFALIAVVSGLQSPLHYTYQYFGSISNGLPELSNQMAGWAMKANVHVYVEDKSGRAIIQLENHRMVQYNEVLGCDAVFNIPEEKFIKPPPEMETIILRPFRVNLYGPDDYSIEYGEENLKWLINMRKGLVTAIKNEVLRGNFEGPIEDPLIEAIREGKNVNIFSTYEETIPGICRSDYSIHKIPRHVSAMKDFEIQQNYEVDVQSNKPHSSNYHSKTSKTSKTSKSAKKYSKTSRKGSTKTASKYYRPDVPHLDDDLWHAVRSIDFDDCKERVGVQLTPVGFSRSVTGQQYEWTRSRSSVTEYILRGSPGQFRIEKIDLDGITTVAPSGIKGEVIQSLTNQTLKLIAVEALGTVPGLPSPLVKSKNFMFEIQGWQPKPTHSRPTPWINYADEVNKDFIVWDVYGVNPFPKDTYSKFKQPTIDKITKVSLAMTDFDQETKSAYPGDLAAFMLEASVFLRNLKKSDILEIFDHFFAKDLYQSDELAKKLVIDAAATSGSYHPIEAVFEYIKKDKIPPLQIATIFMSLTSNIQSTINFPTIMEYVLSLDRSQHPFLASTVIINFSGLLHQFCIRKNAESELYHGVKMGDFVCEREDITNRYVTYLKDIIHPTDQKETETWEKHLAIRALGILGTTQNFEILYPLAAGRIKGDVRTRILAIYNLQSWRYQDQKLIRTQILDLLREIYSNIGEPSSVRTAALFATTSWKPEPHFWYQIARLSWREPSNKVASFMSQLVHAFATADHPYYKTQNQAAYHASKLAKPFVIKSNIISMLSSLSKDKAGQFEVLSQSVSYDTDLTDITYFLMSDLGGFQMSSIEMQVSLLCTIQDIASLKPNTKEPEGEDDGVTFKVAKNMLQEIQEAIKAKKVTSPYTERSIEFFGRFMEHMNVFLPLTESNLKKVSLFDSTELAAFFLQLTMGYDLVLGKYLRPIDASSFHPSEIGLPIFVSTQTSIVYSETSFTKLSADDLSNINPSKLPNANLNSEVVSRLVTHSSTLLTIFFPWTAQIACAGTQSNRDITLPLVVDLNTKEINEGGRHHMVELAFKSLYKEKFPVVKANNIPNTMIFTLLIDGPPVDFKPVLSSPLKPRDITLPSIFSGLNTEIKWNSELNCPSVALDIAKVLTNPEALSSVPSVLYLLGSPTVKYWDVTFLFDPKSSQTKQIKFTVAKGVFGEVAKGDLTQSTGQESDYDYGQVSQGFHQSAFGQEAFSQENAEGLQEVEFHEFQEVEHETETKNTVQYGDNFSQKSQKLQKHFGGPVSTLSLGFDFNGPEANRSYEFAFTSSKSHPSNDRSVWKSQYAFLRSPIPGFDDKKNSLCIDIQKSYPRISQLDTLEDLLSSDLKKQIKAEVTLGCRGKAVATLKGLYTVSDSWKSKHKEELPKTCNFDQRNPQHNFQREIVYDKVKISASWTKVPELAKFPISLGIVAGVEKAISLQSTNLAPTCDQKPTKEIKIDAHRCPKSETWFMDIDGDDIHRKLETIPHDEFLNYALSVGKRTSQIYPKHKSLFNDESSSCVVRAESVRTFDGYVYEYEPSNCWTVVAKDCSCEQGFVVLVRSSQTESPVPELKYVDVKRGLVAEYIGNSVKVNGKVIDPIGLKQIVKHEGKKLVTVEKKNENYVLHFGKHFTIVLSESVIIHVPDEYKGIMCGLCGDYDDQRENVLVGPKRCVYDDPTLFAKSWASGGDSCDAYSLIGLKEDVETYQKTCQTLDSLQEASSSVRRRGDKFSWIVKNIDGNYCITQSPISHCSSDCSFTTAVNQTVQFNCWPEENSPEKLKVALQGQETTLELPVSGLPYSHKHRTVQVATSCIYLE